MKNWTIEFCVALSLAVSAVSAETIGAPVSFETEDGRNISATINIENGDWWSTGRAEGAKPGEAVEYAGASYAGTRAAVFDGADQAYYFKVESGSEIVYRPVLPVVATNETTVMRGYALANGNVYVDALVKFVPSAAPYADEDEDKFVMWIDSASNVCVSAGYYAESLGKSGLTCKTYTTAKQITDGGWHRVVFELFVPMSERFKSYSAAGRIFIDGEALELPAGETIVKPELKETLESYLTDQAKNAYHFNTLFPAKNSTPATALFHGLGANGNGGGLDDIVYTLNTEPNNLPDPESRYFVLQVKPGLESFDYSIDGAAAVSVSGLGGKRAEVPVLIPTKLGTQTTTTVELSNPVYAANYQSWDLAGIGDDVSASGTTFTISYGGDLVAGKVNVSEDAGYSVCKFSSSAVALSSAITLQSAIDTLVAAGEQTDAQIRLVRDCTANAIITNLAVTLDLAGYTLTCEYDPENERTAITVGEGGQLTIIDSASSGNIAVHGDSADWAVEVQGGSIGANIQAGSYFGLVKSVTDDTSVSGGRYYANGDSSGFKCLNNCVADGYAASWHSDGGYWRVVRAGLTPLALRAISMACVSLGLSAASEAHLEERASLPVVSIVAMNPSFGEETSSIECLVKVTDGDGAIMEANALSLASIVQVSQNLSDWAKPAKLTYGNTGEFGVYSVTITMPSGGSWFMRLRSED